MVLENEVYIRLVIIIERAFARLEYLVNLHALHNCRSRTLGNTSLKNDQPCVLLLINLTSNCLSATIIPGGYYHSLPTHVKMRKFLN